MTKLNLLAPLNTVSYGYVSAYIFKALLKLGVDLRYFPIGQIELEPQFQELIPIIQKEWEVQKAPCLKIWHQFDLSHFLTGGPSIGFPIFELDSFNPREKNHMENVDYLFVASKWAKEVCDSQLSRDPKTTKVVPFGVDLEIFKPYNMMEGTTYFANFGKWEVRKGHDVLIRAFNKAFETTDDVELWMMPTNHMLTKTEDSDWRNYYTQSKLGSKVQIMERKDFHHQVYDIMKYVHCGVFPTRAEGWNMEALELLACGKHLIITDYSGQTEFCNESNSHLLRTDKREKAYDGKVFFGQGDWLDANDIEDQLIEKMRQVHKLNSEGGLPQNEAGIETAKQFTWENTAKTIIQNLNEI